MHRQVHLPFYGSIDHTAAENFDWDLYQTDTSARLRNISLSSIPSSCSPYGQAATRFQHSVGVAQLARVLCEREPYARPWRNELVAAAMLHDSGSPPFSHVAETFLYAATGMTHEQATAQVVGHGEVAALLERYEVDAAGVIALINGDEHPLGRILAGSIDLDNLDNSLTLWRSLGQEAMLYHPLQLIKAFTYVDGVLSLDTALLRELLGWQETRRRLYGVIYDEPNLSASTMLYRAIEHAVAEEALPNDFFRWNEPVAFQFLSTEAPTATRRLLHALSSWRHYQEAYTVFNTEEDPRLCGLYEDWQAKRRFANELSAELGIDPVHLAVYVGRNRGAKAITLPFVGDGAQHCAGLFSAAPGQQRVTVFLQASLRTPELLARIAPAIEAVLTGFSPQTGGHVFF
jgi:HD superfamily phosphohydrolase